MDKLGLAFVIVLSFVFLGEALTLKTMLGTVLMMLGAVVLLYQCIAEPPLIRSEFSVLATETAIEAEVEIEPTVVHKPLAD